MYVDLLNDLCCPVCGSKVDIGSCIKVDESGPQTDLLEGMLHCVTGNSRFPVIDGVAIIVDNLTKYFSERENILPDIVAATQSDEMRAFLAEVFAEVETLEQSYYERSDVWPAYVWAHYSNVETTGIGSDEVFDNDEISAELSARSLTQTIESFLEDSTGELGLDIGCATGGNTHTMASAVKFAVGCDRSYTMVHTARNIRDCGGTFEYEAPLEGDLTERRQVSVDIPAPGQTEFIVADAAEIPFRNGTADVVISMNLIDELPDPQGHIENADDVLSPGGRFIICDPYIWGGISKPEEWIGGTETEEGIERSTDALRTIMTDELGHELVKSDDSVPWILKHSPRRYDLWELDCIVTETSLDEEETRDIIGEGES